MVPEPAGLTRVSMPEIIKCSNLWLIFESWLIFLFFVNNIRDRQTVFNIVAVLMLAGGRTINPGLAQYASGGSLGLQIFGKASPITLQPSDGGHRGHQPGVRNLRPPK